MYRGSRPKIVPIIIVVIIIALVVASLVTVGRMLFNGSSNKSDKKTETSNTIEQSLLDQSSDRSVRWTVRGPIVANEKFKSYQITINQAYRTYTTYTGYLDRIVESKSYDNNAKAYEQFTFALDKANIDVTRKSTNEDLRGVCATQGLAYQFETLVGDTPSNSIWSSTCKDSPGTMGAKALQIQALFVNQIPDFHPLFDRVY